jgi:hypothetical protein
MKTALLRLAVLALLAGPSAALAQTTALQSPAPDTAAHATTLALSATGEVRTAPDQAIVTLGVSVQALDAAAAMRANAARMAQVLAALKRQGQPGRDIQTANLSLNAQYVYAQNQPPKLSGYQASNDVVLTVEDLGRLGPILDAAGAAGATEVRGVSFGLKDPQAAEDTARLQAVKALKAKAELYAQAEGLRIVRLASLTENGGYQPGPPQPMFAMAKAASASTPVEAGQLSVRVEVSAVYELAP